MKMQERNILQSVEREWSMLLLKSWTTHRYDLIFHEFLGAESSLVDATVPYSDVHRTRIGRREVIVHGQSQIDIGVELGEVCEPRDEPDIREIRHYADTKLPPRWLTFRPGFVQRCINFQETAPQTLCEATARWRRNHLRANASKQRISKHRFELPDLMTDRTMS